MGVDIHLLVEKKVEGEWKLVDNNLQNINLDITDEGSYLLCYHDKYDQVYWMNDDGKPLYSILANVSNYYDIPYIKDLYDKGKDDIPKDCSLEARYHLEEYATYGYGCYTLKELLAFDWEQNCKISCVVDQDEYEKYRKGMIYLSATAMSADYHVSEHEYLILKENNRIEPNKRYAITLKKEEILRDMCNNFYVTIKLLSNKVNDLDKIRILFGFEG